MSAEPEVTALAVVEQASSIQLGTLHAQTPQQLVASGTALATALASVIDQQKLYVNIQGRKHVRCEGWTTLATMLGVLPREVSVEALEDGSYVATVELVRMSDGAVLSRASAECGMDEPTWKTRHRYARRSMAVTRATGKVCRIAFSWIVALAGYDPTPFEEIPEEERHAPKPAPAAAESHTVPHASAGTPRPKPEAPPTTVEPPVGRPQPNLMEIDGKTKLANWTDFKLRDESGVEYIDVVPFGRLCGRFLAQLSDADLKNTREFCASKTTGYFPLLAAGCVIESRRRSEEIPF